MTHIWIDADSCPRLVREYTADYAQKNHLPLTLVANKPVPAGSYEKNFEMVICPAEKDAADNYIVSSASEKDIVITRDILLAERLVAKNISVINDRGTAFTKDNIQDKIADRNFDLQLAQIGLGGSKKSSYGEKEFSKFKKCFERELQKLKN